MGKWQPIFKVGDRVCDYRGIDTRDSGTIIGVCSGHWEAYKIRFDHGLEYYVMEWRLVPLVKKKKPKLAKELREVRIKIDMILDLLDALVNDDTDKKEPCVVKIEQLSQRLKPKNTQ